MDLTKPHLGHALCLYDNDADSPNELNFLKGTRLLVFQQNPAGLTGWWLCGYDAPATKNGQKASFRIGIAPSNRLRLLTSCPKCIQQLHTSGEPFYNAPSPSDSAASASVPPVPAHKLRPAGATPTASPTAARSREDRAHIARSQAFEHELNSPKLKPKANFLRPTTPSASPNSLRKCNSLELLDAPSPVPEDDYLQLGDVGAYRVAPSARPNTPSKLPVPSPRPNAQPPATANTASKPIRQITAPKLPPPQGVNGSTNSTSTTPGISNAPPPPILVSSASKDTLDKRSAAGANVKYANETSPQSRSAIPLSPETLPSDSGSGAQDSNYCNMEFVASLQRVSPSAATHPPLPRHGATAAAAARNPTANATSTANTQASAPAPALALALAPAPVLPTRDHKPYDLLPVTRFSVDTSQVAVLPIAAANSVPAAGAVAVANAAQAAVASTAAAAAPAQPPLPPANQKTQASQQQKLPPAPNYAQKPKLKVSQTSMSSASSGGSDTAASATGGAAATATTGGLSSGEDDGRNVLGDLPAASRFREKVQSDCLDNRAPSPFSVSAAGAGGRERVTCAAGTSLSLPVGSAGAGAGVGAPASAAAAAQSPSAKRALLFGTRSSSAHNLSVGFSSPPAAAAAAESSCDYEEVDVNETCVDEDDMGSQTLNQKTGGGRKRNSLKVCRLDADAALGLFGQHFSALQDSVSQLLAFVRPKWKEYANLMRVLPDFRAALAGICVHLDELVMFAEAAQVNSVCVVNDRRLAKQFERSLFLMRQAQERLGADAVPLDRAEWRWPESEARSNRAADLLYRLDCLVNATRDLLLNLRTLNALVVGNAKLLFTGTSAQRSGTDTHTGANSNSGTAYASSPALGCNVKSLSSQNLSLSPLAETPGLQRAYTSSTRDLSARPPAARPVGVGGGAATGSTYMATLLRGGRLRDTAPLLAIGLSTSTGHLNLTAEKPAASQVLKQSEPGVQLQSDASAAAAGVDSAFGRVVTSTSGAPNPAAGSQPNLAFRPDDSEKQKLVSTTNRNNKPEASASGGINRNSTATIIDSSSSSSSIQKQQNIKGAAEAATTPTDRVSAASAVNAEGERARAAAASTPNPSSRLSPALESALAACEATRSAQHELLLHASASTPASTSPIPTSTPTPTPSSSNSTSSSSTSTSATSASAGPVGPSKGGGGSAQQLQLQASGQQLPTPAELTLAHNQLASLVDALMALLDECATPSAFIERTRLVLLQAYRLLHLSHRISTSSSSSTASLPVSSATDSLQRQQLIPNVKPSALSAATARTKQAKQPDANQRHQLQALEQELEEQLRALLAACREAALTFPAQEQRVALARAAQTCVLLSSGLRNTLAAAIK